MEQLKILGEQAGVPTLPIMANQSPLDIAKRAMAAARVGGYDVLILDTAGRQHIDEHADGRSRRRKSADGSARDAAGRGFADRPGRGKYRQVLQ